MDLKRSGWYAAMAADYKTDYFTPGLRFWYASGDDAKWTNGSERMPSIYGDVTATSYGFDGTNYSRSDHGLQHRRHLGRDRSGR